MNKKADKNQKSSPNLQQEIEQTMDQLPEILSNILGKPLSDESNRSLNSLKTDMMPKISNLDNDLIAIRAIKNRPLQIKEMFQSLDGLAQTIGASSGETMPKYIADKLEKISISNIKTPPFFEKTKYVQYGQAATNLIQQVYSTTALKTIIDYITEASSSDDVMTNAPAIGYRLPVSYKFLAQKRERFNKTSMEKYISIYDELAGVYEKEVAFILGLIKLSQGKIPKYSTIRKKPLADKVKYLKDSNYNILAGDFDVFIRNAKAHKSYLINIPKRRIEYYPLSGKGQPQIVTYREMAQKTTDLSALVVVMSQMQGMCLIEFLRKLENYS